MQLHEQPDSELVQQIQSGHEAAFNELMRRYKLPVVNFVYRLLGSVEDAQDVAQEIFVRVYRNVDTVRPETKFSTWLFALARHAAIDHWRRRQRHPAEPLESVPPLVGRSDTVEDVAAREVSHEIAAAVEKLPEDQRVALILAEYHGLSYAEVAEILRCTEKSVEARLYRAKQTLRGRLRHLLE